MEFKGTKMRVAILVLMVTIFFTNLFTQNENLSNINDEKYNIKLIKFYIEKNEYEKALEYIDKTLEEVTGKDSLFFFKGYIYIEYEDWKQASESFAKAILHTSDEKLINEWLAIFEKAIIKVSPLTAFDFVSTAVSEAKNTQKHIGFLNILARLYENNQLYGEANDVYRTILLEIEESERWDLKIKIATNKIFQKEYDEALNILEPLIVIDDSLYNEKLLFLDYIANISLENYDKAKTSLIRLYLDFPDHTNRKEILTGLSEIFVHQEQSLMSWYILNELFKISDEVQRFKLKIDIDRIKQKICESNAIEDQFKYFKPVFEIEKQNILPEINE
jgi:Tfp pilus assembly protein PilF